LVICGKCGSLDELFMDQSRNNIKASEATLVVKKIKCIGLEPCNKDKFPWQGPTVTVLRIS